MKYHYHERTEEGYNRDEVKTFKKKVGDPFEDIPLEKLAGAVMAQLARRDVWIVDVEVYELSKRQISFKETKGGIVIKNKKFLFDGGTEDSTIIVQEMVEVPQHQSVNIAGREAMIQSPQNPGTVSYNPTTGGVQPHNQNGQRRPVDWMVFSPELQQMSEIRQLRLTPEKKYPIMEKKAGVMGETYLLLDDTGREQLVSDRYFVPANVNLFADRELGFSETSKQRDGGKLYWGGANNEPDMPVIRR